MPKNIAKQTTAYFLAASLVFPAHLFANSNVGDKSQQEIKKIISVHSSAGKTVNNSDLVLLSLLSAAVAGIGGAYAGSVWQKAKTASAKDSVIKQLNERIAFLNQAIKVEEREEGRLLRVLDEQTDLFAKMIKTNDTPARDLSKAQLMGFNRGYDAAFLGQQELGEVYYEKGFRAGYGQKATEDFMAGKATVFPKSGKLSRIEAEKLIESLKQELSRLQGSLGSVKASAAADEQIISLMTQTNKNLLRLESASSSKEISAIESELISAAHRLNNIPASGAKKELLENFSGTLLRTLKKRGGVLGLGALALFSAGVIVVSQDKPAAEISHNRLNIQRVFKETYEARPELFSAQMFILAEEHGTDLVASVLYENQKYLPLLEAQLSIMSSTKLIQTLSILKGSNSPEQTKELLLESLSAAS